MSDLMLIVFFASLILCVILFLIYFVYLFRHVMSIKRGSDFIRQMQMHPLQLERFSASEGDDLETETTSICIPIQVPQPTPAQSTVNDASDKSMRRSRSGFFQLPPDSYYKYSLVDESLSASSRNSSGKKSKNGSTKERSADRPENLWEEGMTVTENRRKNTWESLVMHYLGVQTPDHFYVSKDELEEIFYGRLPTISENKEFLI